VAFLWCGVEVAAVLVLVLAVSVDVVAASAAGGMLRRSFNS